MKAFPMTHPSENTRFIDAGMDLRDYFAAKAMQAILAKCDEKSSDIDEVGNWVGEYSYDVADAMIRAR